MSPMQTATAPATTSARDVTLRYFAWVREKTGMSEERVTLPPSVETATDLLCWMQTRGPQFAAAFAHPEAIRVALDRAHVKPGAKIGGAKEIAFFPPVTGG